MKRMLILFSTLVATIMLTGFAIEKPYSNDNNMGNNWIYYTSVTAWTEATESQTIYIYYKQGNGVRKYRASIKKYSSDELWELTYYGTTVGENPYYQDRSCNDFRRNYRYRANGYFNANLPYMERN